MKIGTPFSQKMILLVSIILTFCQGFSQSTVPSCTALSNIPISGSTDLPLDVNFIWPASDRVASYALIVGTSSGGAEILDNVNVGNVTMYDLPDYLPAGETIYVRVVSINGSGQNQGCWETTFTTTGTEIVDCVYMTWPEINAIDVPVDTSIEWTASPNATGYRITLGSSSGDNDIVNDFDNGNATSFQLTGDFDLLISVFVTITPYDDFGGNTTCQEFQFTTTSGTVPGCSNITFPQDGTNLIPVNSEITWTSEPTATGYQITIREGGINGNFILMNEEAGNGDRFKPPNFQPRTSYFVTLSPYNDQGNAIRCSTISFTTGDRLPIPDCTSWISPLNDAVNVSVFAKFEWEAMTNIDGFLLSIGTSSNGTDILNMEDLGNVTSYTHSQELPEGAIIYATINTYNGDEVSESCPIISFRVEGGNLNDEIPKFFTPNNDGFNDLWTVISTNKITVDKIFIFDRQGTLLKQLGEGQGWDGIFNGNRLPSSSYWYSVKLINGPDLRGSFMLKR